MRMTKAVVGLLFVVAALQKADAGQIQLNNGTGTFSQSGTGGPFSPSQAVDGLFTDPNGWAIFDPSRPTNDRTTNQTAVWETDSDLSAGSLVIKMHFNHFNPGHLLGRFRFSVTTDDRGTFADGLDSAGDVTANWTVLEDPNVSGPNGMTFTTLSDDSVLAGGTTASNGVYTVTYSTSLSGITGLRLEALEHSSLPSGNGPGLFDATLAGSKGAGNGNFLLTELTLNHTPVPEPTSLALLGIGAAALFGYGRRRKRKLVV